MKKITTILTALILMFTLTFTTGCKKDNGKTPVDPTKTTKQVVIGNDWKFTNGTALRTNGTLDDLTVSFEADSTLTITPEPADFTYTNYVIAGDSVKAVIAYKTSLGAPTYGFDDTLFYNLKLDRNTFVLNGDKIKSTFIGGTYFRLTPTNITLSIK